MKTLINPIVAESDAPPRPIAGCVVVAYDGRQVHRMDARDRTIPTLAPTVPLAPDKPPEGTPVSMQPMFNADSPFVQRSRIVGQRISDVTGVVAGVGASVLGRMVRRTAIGNALLGAGERYFQVDVGKKNAELGFDVDSASKGIPFRVTMTLRVQVVDPEKVVVEGIRDLVERFEAPLRVAIVDEAANHQADEFDAARRAFQRALMAGWSDGAVSVTDIAVRVTVDEKALQYIRTMSEEAIRKGAVRSNQAVGSAELDGTAALMSDPERLLAAWVHTRNDIYRAAYVQKIEDRTSEVRSRLALLELAIKNGLVEKHEVADRYPDLAGALLDQITPSALLGSTRPATGKE